MTRLQFLDMLYRRRKTVDFSNKTVDFLEAMNRPVQNAHGVPTEVDGDALAVIRQAVSA
ncbi:hypothetical protein ACF1AJ_20660 [Leifsonia sp. NPDC014704]|uniref:hypothetical protein n=1 Tax=Leifsonia sp. NPDC014704 TaxID=3364123 RepID=UPI0036F4969F